MNLDVMEYIYFNIFSYNLLIMNLNRLKNTV